MFRLVLIIFLSLVTVCSRPSPIPAHNAPVRIVSFAPSITETLFALGLGDKVVGVTKFCAYPPQAEKLPRVGGYLDPNYEVLLSLKPDLVVLLREHKGLIGFLDKNGIRSLTINNETVDGILESFEQIARASGIEERGHSLADSVRAALNETTIAGNRPRVLLCVGRDNPGTGTVAKVYAAGPRSFYNTLLESAGATNCITDSTSAYPPVNLEGLVHLNPDIIVDFMNFPGTHHAKNLAKDWSKLDMLKAVRNGRIHCLGGDYLTIPGPRITRVHADLRKILEQTSQAAQQHGSPDSEGSDAL